MATQKRLELKIETKFRTFSFRVKLDQGCVKCLSLQFSCLTLSSTPDIILTEAAARSERLENR